MACATCKCRKDGGSALVPFPVAIKGAPKGLGVLGLCADRTWTWLTEDEIGDIWRYHVEATASGDPQLHREFMGIVLPVVTSTAA